MCVMHIMRIMHNMHSMPIMHILHIMYVAANHAWRPSALENSDLMRLTSYYTSSSSQTIFLFFSRLPFFQLNLIILHICYNLLVGFDTFP